MSHTLDRRQHCFPYLRGWVIEVHADFIPQPYPPFGSDFCHPPGYWIESCCFARVHAQGPRVVTVRVNHSIQEQRQPKSECPVGPEEEDALHSVGEAFSNLLACLVLMLSKLVQCMDYSSSVFETSCGITAIHSSTKGSIQPTNGESKTLCAWSSAPVNSTSFTCQIWQ